MKKEIKKVLSLLLAGVMIFSLAGCEKHNKESETAKKEFYYVPSYQEIAIEADYISRTIAIGDELYLFGSKWDEETQENAELLYHYQMQTGELRELPLELSENAYVQQVSVNADGNFFMIVNKYEALEEEAADSEDTRDEAATDEAATDEAASDEAEGDFDTAVVAEEVVVTGDAVAVTEGSSEKVTAVIGGSDEEAIEEVDFQNLTELWEISAEDGSVLQTVDLAGVIEDLDNFWPQYMEVDGQGNIYLSDGNNNIYVLDIKGNKLFTVTLDNWVDSLFAAGDGLVYIKAWGDTGLEVRPVDVQTRQIGTPVNWEGISGNNAYGQKICKGEGSSLLVSDSNGVFICDSETGKKEDLFAWLDTDINSDDVEEIGQLSDGRYWAMLSEYGEESTEYSFVILTKTPASEVTVKEEIVMGAMWIDQDMRKNIIDFNKSNEKYHISVKEYGTDDYETGRTQFNNDIASGNCPDIIDISYIDFEQYANKGVLEDLYPYMEKDGIAGEDYLENILKAYEIDGKLYSIIPRFYIVTTAAKASKVGQESGWTLQEMLEFAKSSDAENIFAYATRESIFYYCIYNNIDNFINWETGECNFTGEEFIHTLEFANQFPEEWDYSSAEEEEGTSAKLRSDKLLLMQTTVSSVQEYQMMNGLFGEKVTYIGYPNSERKGNLIQPVSGSLAISARSDHKDGAWEFVKIFLSDEYQDGLVAEWGSGFGFPLKKSALEKQFKYDMTPQYYEDENGEKTEAPITSWGYDDFDIDIYAASQEEIDAVREMIASAEKLTGSVNEELTNIINEETAAYFKGQKSAEDTAAVIQNRIQIYVNENR